MKECDHDWDAEADKNQNLLYKRFMGQEVCRCICKKCNARTWMSKLGFDAWLKNKNRVRDSASKVLHSPNSSKKAKMARGSALTQRQQNKPTNRCLNLHRKEVDCEN